MTNVAESTVSWRTSTTRPRTSRAAPSGLQGVPARVILGAGDLRPDGVGDIGRDFDVVLGHATYGTVTYGSVSSRTTEIPVGTAVPGWHTRPGRGPAHRRRSARRPRPPDRLSRSRRSRPARPARRSDCRRRPRLRR